jgi:hypothetical protein
MIEAHKQIRQLEAMASKKGYKMSKFLLQS